MGTSDKRLWGVVALIVLGLGVAVYLVMQPAGSAIDQRVAQLQATLAAVATPTRIAPSRRLGEDYYKMYALDGVTYDMLARDTERYQRNVIPLAGTVLQVVEDDAGAVLRLAVDGDIQDVVLVTYPGYATRRVLAGDKVRLYGTVLGRVDYTTVLGQPLTAPAVEAGWLTITRG